MLRALLTVMFTLSLSTPTLALEAPPRAGSWEFSLAGIQHGKSGFSADNGNTRLDLSQAGGLGFSLGYNYSNNLLLNFEYSRTQPDYQVSFPSVGGRDSFSHRATLSSGQFNATWHLFTGPLTPYLRAGLGWSNINSNIGTGRVVCGPGYRYWYWSWYCTETTYGESGLTYNGAIGVRWDISDLLFIRASYESQWQNNAIGADSPRFDIGRFELGFRL